MADTSNHNAPDPPDGEALAGRSDMSQIRLRKPEIFSSYELLARIRIGGMAEIFRARDLGADGREVALKRILPSFTDEAEYVAMFLDEARLAQRLHHPGIVEAYDIGQEEDSHFIALEYVDGQDVGVLVHRACERSEPVPVGLACHVGVAVCEALQYAHELGDDTGAPLGVVHRDVSPQNILLGYDGEVKLIDFGIAKSAEQIMKTQAGFLKGKHGYLSPEQAAGESVDRRSDLFSLAVCLYELLTAERLFKGASDFSTLQQVKKAVVPSLTEKNPKVPEGLEAILTKALAKNPDDRYATAAELGEALSAFMEQEEVVFGRANLAAYMEETFAEERAREAQGDAEAPAHGDESTGLSAFDDLDPPSAVSELSELPPESDWDDDGEAAEVASAELSTVEPASIEAIEVGDEDIEPVSSLGSLEGATGAVVTDAPEEIVETPEEADVADGDEVTEEAELAAAVVEEPDAQEDSARAEADEVVEDGDDITAVERPLRPRAAAKATAAVEAEAEQGEGEAEAEEVTGEGDAKRVADAEASDDEARPDAVSAVSTGGVKAVEDVVAAAVEDSTVPGHLQGSTLPGLGMDWDDEELATQVYDEQEGGGDPAMPKPLPPVGAPSPFGAPRASVPPAPSPRVRTRTPTPQVGQVRMPGAPSMRPPAYPTPSAPPQAPVARTTQRPPATLVLLTVAGIIAVIALGLHFFRKPETATLHLNTAPPDTVVTLDGQRVPGTSSPFVITDVTPGDKHELRVEKEGYAPWSTQIATREGQVVQLPKVELIPHVDVNVAAALTQPTAPAAAPEAAAQPEAAAAPEPPASAHAPAPAPTTPKPAPRAAPDKTPTKRFERVRSEPRVAAGRWKPPPAAAPAASGDGGILRINSRPWAQVIVDGRTIGTTPQMRIPVSAGKHTVTLTNPQFGVKRTLTLDVKPGQTVTRIITLTP